MKICPRCQKTYPDDNLNFCLEDGSVLNQMQTAPAPPPPTVQMNQPPITEPPQQPQMQSQPSGQPAWNVGQPQMQPKKSKAWVWVLLILGAVVLLCGGGLGGLIYIGMQQANNNSNIVTFNNGHSPSPSPTKSTTSDSSRSDVEKIDISQWVKDFSLYGTTENVNGEFIMSSKQKGYYYVLAAPDNYTTDDADTRVTLRNIDDASSSLGYGLIFHSNPTPLQQDYAFLINTKTKKYRVVHHEPSKETSVITWTNSPAIKGGTDENMLEIHDLSDKIELYINGTMVNSIKNIYGYAGGVPGLYSGDGVKIAFKDLEIRK